MLRLTAAVLAIALTSTAAAGWRELRVDGSSEDGFKESVALLQDKLSPSRRHAFERALQDIWFQGVQQASAEQRQYKQADYFAQLDGLVYEQVVELLDPTGTSAKRYRAEYYTTRLGGSVATPNGRNGLGPSAFNPNCCYPLKAPGANWRGGPQTQQQ